MRTMAPTTSLEKELAPWLTFARKAAQTAATKSSTMAAVLVQSTLSPPGSTSARPKLRWIRIDFAKRKKKELD